MLLCILTDFLTGLVNSVRIDLFLMAFKNNKFKKLIFKLFFYNFIMYFLPFLIFKLIYYFYDIFYYSNLIMYPITIFSQIFHLFHFIELINILCAQNFTNSRIISKIDLITFIIIVSLYQFTIYILTLFVYLMIYDKSYFLYLIINFVILSIYHSFYCFNNLWQFKKKKIASRINIIENIWPYFIGYGTIASIIHINNNNSLMSGLYNMYLTTLLTFPFLKKSTFSLRKKYPAISLNFISHMTNIIFVLSKKILNFIYNT